MKYLLILLCLAGCHRGDSPEELKDRAMKIENCKTQCQPFAYKEFSYWSGCHCEAHQ